MPKVGVVLIGVIWGGLGCSVANNGGGSYLQAGVDQGRGGSNGGGNTSVGSGGTIVPGECTLNCGNPAAGSCSSPQVRITEIDVGVTVVNNESETELMPLALAAIPSGGSRLAWMGSDDRVYVARLDCEDQLVGSPFSFPAHDFKDIGADNAGGVVVLTRDALGDGTLNCGNPSNLCDGGPNPPIPCYDMFMARFDCAGNEVWTTLLTTADASLPPYSTSGTGPTVNMIWWYQHHGRIAFDGSNYATYFCNAISISEGGCINIHEGDRMQVVGPDGSVLDHPDSFGGGCSHSWNTRMVWDESTGHFVMVCATDNVGRVARPAPYRTIWTANDLGSLSVGNLVVANGEGYWVTVSDQGTIHLLHFTEDTPDQDITVASSDFSHLASYGATRMVAAWESGSSIAARVYDAGTGAEVSPEFSIDASDNRYQAFKEFPDGSVAYPAPGNGSTSIRIARLLPCTG